MSGIVHKLGEARIDLIEIYYRYAKQGTKATARRFLVQAEATFNRLAKMPGVGTRYDADEPLYNDLRYFPISKFRRYLVFYREIPRGIEIVRVLHGSRDIDRILTEGFDIDQSSNGSDDKT
jgi:toxin ParE1/3/4